MALEYGLLMAAAATKFVAISQSQAGIPRNDIYFQAKLELTEAQLAWMRALLAEEVSQQSLNHSRRLCHTTEGRFQGGAARETWSS